MIRINNLSKCYGELKAVDDLSLEIKSGEFFAFLGPNAAGKTTTIKLLTGLLKPTKGSAEICGFDVQKDYLKAKALVSYIPDFPFLYDKLTGREFLEFVSNLYPQVDMRERKRTMEMYLNELGLKSDENMLIEHYSHGMRQKLVFSAAFIHDPKVMIIDEPMVGLDPHAARIIKNMLKQKSKEGVTIFLSTHVLSVAEELADRIGIIDHGRLITQGSLKELAVSAGMDGKLEDLFLRLTEEDNGVK